MINGLEGIPGSGKSYEATVYHVLEFLKKGRLVVTNLPLAVDAFAAIDPRYADLIEIRSRPRPVLGTWDANRVDDKGNGNAFKLWTGDEEQDGRKPGPLVLDGGEVKLRQQVSESVPVFGHVWDFYHEWKHPETGQGPVFVIDECHVALPKLGTDAQVIQWFKLHRHFNVDVLLMTQNFRDICPPIANLLAMLVRCRKADFLGKPDHYVRKVFAGFRGAVVSSEERKYRPEFFRLYKSHTQGSSVAESLAGDVSPFIVKFRRATVAWCVIGAIVCTWLLWPSGKPKPGKPGKPPEIAGKALPASPGASAPAGVASGPLSVASAPGGPVVARARSSEPPEPLADKGIHLKGRLQLGDRVAYVFVVSQNGQPVQTFWDRELVEAGYTFRPLGDCMGVLEWRGSVRAISCDLPVVNMVNERKG